MKKSEAVICTLLTGGVLAAILHHEPVYRDEYKSREDCLADWNNESNCERAPTRAVGGYHYFGPSYEGDARPRTPAQHLVQSRGQITRSGFGRSGARFSGGG